MFVFSTCAIVVCLIKAGPAIAQCVPASEKLLQLPLVSQNLVSGGLNPAVTGATLWPEGLVYFTIDRAYSPTEEQQIKRTLDIILNSTCLKFVPNRDCLSRSYVHFNKGSSFTGTRGMRGGKQYAGLSARNLRTVGDSAHQLFHTIGFAHEDQRTDAEQYVSFGCGPFLGRERRVFANELADFDFNSVTSRMRYASCGVRPLDGDPMKRQAIMRTPEGPTELDLRKINLAYSCQPAGRRMFQNAILA